MPTFARRLGWLQKVFPPAGGAQTMPTEYSDDIVLTHPSVPPSSQFENLISDYFLQTDITAVYSGRVPSGKFWWVQSCSAWQNTGAAQHMRIEVHAINGNSVSNRGVVLASDSNVVSSGGGQIQFTVPRRFIVPPGGLIAAHLTVGTVGTGPILQIQYLELDIGQEVW